MHKKPKNYSLATAQNTLRDADAVMANLIAQVGPTQVRSEACYTVYQSLARAIVYQMLSTKSAAAIHARLVDSCADDVCPQTVLALGEHTLREIGFSRAKVASIIDLSEKIQSGDIPDDEQLASLSDQDLISCLTQVKGIGVWSVEMLMIFNLGRADVFPATDLGVRKGHMMAYGLQEMLSAKELLGASECWRPYRTVAAWYLWRATDSVDWS